MKYPLISLFGYSSPADFEWHNVSVTLPFIAPVNVSVTNTLIILLKFESLIKIFVAQLVFYALCNRHVEDAVALDNIFIGPPSVNGPPTISPPTSLSTTINPWTTWSTTIRPSTTGPPTASTTTTRSSTTTYDPRTTTPWTTQQPGEIFVHGAGRAT